MITTDLTVIWAGIVLFSIFAYVVMDGFDLGIGILFNRFAAGRERDTAMNSIAPVWDGNETWLIMGGGGLLAAFPLAYAILLSALYVPLMIMLLALVFRGVAFEFRWRDPAHRAFWDAAFSGGSLVTALFQGVILGAILQGISVTNRLYTGGPWDWLTPFSLLTGAGVVVAYALLGACWLILKTDGELQAYARRHALPLTGLTLGAIGIVSAATPLLAGHYFDRWLAWPQIVWVAPVPVLTALLGYALARSLHARHELAPFLLTLGLFTLCFVGLGVSMFPYIVPHGLTIWDTATARSSQQFSLAGAAVMLPVIIAYSAWSYRVFRGKVTAEGYH